MKKHFGILSLAALAGAIVPSRVYGDIHSVDMFWKNSEPGLDLEVSRRLLITHEPKISFANYSQDSIGPLGVVAHGEMIDANEEPCYLPKYFVLDRFLLKMNLRSLSQTTYRKRQN